MISFKMETHSWLTATFSVVICLLVFQGRQTDAQSAHGSNVCSYRVSSTYQYYTRVSYGAYTSYRTCCSHFMWCWKKCTRYRWVRRYRNEIRYRTTYNTYYRCCNGWRQGSGSSSCLIPICNRPACSHGQCVRPNTCSCNSGYTNPSQGCNADINECATSNGGCDQQCYNFPGSYRCACRRGFRLVGNTRCQDNDECSTSQHLCICDDAANNPACSATCQNTLGSYRCGCSSGYRLVGSRRCADINECMMSNGHCSHYCTNTPGSHQCSCHTGYQLDSNRKTCSDINECLVSNGGCDHECINRNGSYSCRCRKGYVLDSNGKTCSDVDECLIHLHDCQHICNNYRGSFYCSCNTGYRLNQDNKTCSDIDECNEYRLGAGGVNTTVSGCTQNCQNTLGSFTCSCNVGFKLGSDGKTCQDIDECASASNDCKHICVNNIGSYQCRCQPGYKLNVDGRKCDAQPCIRHPAVINGAGTCFFGKTNDTCEFRCSPGFDFRGSQRRRCQANHTWSGSLPTCARKNCEALSPPTNGGITLPCFKYYQAICKLQCNDGYYATGPLERSCRATINNTMYWNNLRTKCEEITVCAPNPCKHGGLCNTVSKEKYRCNCHGTSYVGPKCERGIVQKPEYPVMNVKVEYAFNLTAKPDTDLRVSLLSKDPNLHIKPTELAFNSSKTIAIFTIYADAPGPYIISYKLDGSDADDFNHPLNNIVFFRKPNISKGVDAVINDKGGLSKGCHRKEVRGGDDGKGGYTLCSTDKFVKRVDQENTDGVTSMDVQGASGLPTSLVGTAVTNENLVNNEFDDFINQYKRLNDTQWNISEIDLNSKCVSEKPTTKYLTEMVELNSFPKTVEDGINQNTPPTLKVRVGRTAKTFKPNDLQANIQLGEALKRQYPYCGAVLKGVKDDEAYYAFATGQNIVLQMAEEEMNLEGGNHLCLFKSIKENQTLFAFPNSSTKSEVLKSSTGFEGKLKSIHISNSTDKFESRMFGEFSTIMHSHNSTKINITLNGDLIFQSSGARELLTNGITALDSLLLNGEISLDIDDNSSGIMEKTVFTGNGSIQMNHTDDNVRREEYLVTLYSIASGSINRLLRGIVKLNANAKILNSISTISSGGWVKDSQNSSDSYKIQSEMHLLNNTMRAALHEALSRHAESKHMIMAVLGDLDLGVASADAFSKHFHKSTGSIIIQDLLSLKEHLHSIDRRLQVLSMKYQDSGFNASNIIQNISKTFHESMSKVEGSLKKPLNRTNVTRVITSRSVNSKGTICLQRLCFKDCDIEVSYFVPSRLLNDRFGIKIKDEIVTAVIGKLNDEVLLGDNLRIPRNGYIVLAVTPYRKTFGFFNGSLQMYGRQFKCSVRYSENKLKFSGHILLPDGSNTKIEVVSNIQGVINHNEVVFNVKGTLDKNSTVVQSINHWLHAKMTEISEHVSKRLETLKKAVNISEKQKYQAELNLKRTDLIYRKKTLEASEIENEINTTGSLFKHHKSILMARLQRHDSTIVNYTKAIEQCPPKVCITKCVPGLIAGICFDDRYEHVTMQSCEIETKMLKRTEVEQVSSQRSYVTYNARSTCNSRCPPLTGFFKNLFGRRKRREIDDNEVKNDVALVRKRRGVIMWLAKKALKKVVDIGGEKLFGFLGGEAGALGAKIGSKLPGPFGVVGMIVGGVIGSAFGSCDKICTTELVPKLNNYIHYEAIKVIKEYPYKDSVCEDVVVRKKIGYLEGHECFRQSNCSEAITDAQCVQHNHQCKVIRMILREKIKQERDVGQTFIDYEKSSLTLETLQMKKRAAIQQKNNAYKSLLIAKASLLKSNYTHELSRQSLTNAHRLLASEMKVQKLIERFGREAISVDSGKFQYRISKGSAASNIIALLMDVKRKDDLFTATTSLIDFKNMNMSIDDATEDIIQVVPYFQSRVRRSTEDSTFATVSVDERFGNATKEKCKIIERNVLYLSEIPFIFLNGISQFELAKQAFVEAGSVKENFTKLVQDTAIASTSCNEESSDTACSNQWLKSLFGNATKDDNKINETVLVWEAKRATIMAEIEKFTKNQNFTNCGGSLDCVQTSINAISDKIKYDSTKASVLAKQETSRWESYFQVLLEKDDMNVTQTKMNSNILLESIKKSQVTKVYCDSPPFFLKDLPLTAIATSSRLLQLQVEVAASMHEVTFAWQKDGELLKEASSNTLTLGRNTNSVSGYYFCVASNRFGSVASKTVRVMYQEKPRITKDPADVNTTVKQPNGHIRLMCNATGKPSPTIRWFFMPFNSTTRPVDLENNDTLLLINKTRGEQSGFYYCNASNYQGFVLSRNATVRVRKSIIAEFVVDISFAVKVSNQNISMSNGGTVNDTNVRNETKEAKETVHGRNETGNGTSYQNETVTGQNEANRTNSYQNGTITGQNETNRTSSFQGQNATVLTFHRDLPEFLSSKDQLDLTERLSQTMNVSKSRIRSVQLERRTPKEGILSMSIIAKDLTSLLQESTDWTMISEDVVMARKGLLVLPLWLQYFYSNMSSELKIAGLNSVVLSDTVQFSLADPTCPVGYSLNSNGFICEICTAGSMFVPGTGCQLCPIGTYQSQQGKLGCIACHVNLTTNTVGSVYSGACIVQERPTTPPDSSTTTKERTTAQLESSTSLKHRSTTPPWSTKTDTRVITSTSPDRASKKPSDKTSKSPSKNPTTGKKEAQIVVIVGATVPLMAICIMLIIIFLIVKKRNRTQKEKQHREEPEMLDGMEFANLSYDIPVKEALRIDNPVYDVDI